MAFKSIDRPADGNRIRSLAAVLAAAFGVGITISLATPLVSLTVERAGHGGLVVGGLMAAYALTAFLIGPFTPALLRRFGMIPVLAGGTMLAALSLLAFPFTSILFFWFVFRLLTGVGFNFAWIASETWINAIATEADRGRIIGIYASIWGVGVAAGPAILALTGSEGLLPFVICFGLLSASLLPLWPARHLAPKLTPPLAPWGVMKVVRVAPLAIGAGVLSGIGEATFFALIPIYGLRVGFEEAGAVLLTTVFGVGTIALQYPTGWLADRTDRRALLAGVVALALVCAVAVPFAIGSFVLWPVVFVWGGMIAGFYTLGLVLLAQRFASGDLAAANTTFIMSYTLGMIIGPLVAGAAMEAWSPHGLILAICLSYIVFLAGMAWERLAPARKPAE
ncbi:MAG: MFS transporter [Alphaproteobacteria bacterium]|jgi:MFS family permease|nr:MFS transporter [Alphaproteobacteria bacterium]